MLKRIFVIATLLVSLPMLAQAGVAPWKVNTWAKSQGGSVKTALPSGPTVTTVTVANGSTFNTYTSASVKVTVAPNSGFKISNLTKQGIVQTLSNPAVAQDYILTPDYTKTQSIYGTFARVSYTLSAKVGTAGGTVSPSKLTAYAGFQTPPKVFTLAPSTGKYVASVTGMTGAAGVDYQFVNAVTGAPVSLPAPVGVKVKLNIVNVTTNVNLTVNFGTTGANAGPNKTVVSGSLVTLDGSASTGTAPISYAWSQVQGPTVTLSSTTAQKPTFTAPATAATLRFKLIVNNQSLKPSYTFVYVSSSVVAAAQSQCNNCHKTQGIGQDAFNNWSGSIHAKNAFHKVMCYDCHDGSNAGGHPGTPQCFSCHNGTYGGPAVASAEGAQDCAYCHSQKQDIHDVDNTSAENNNDCLFCHAIAAPYHKGNVNDNNGVRAIVAEFGKWSHHVTGVNLNNAHCAACHLEGKVDAGAIVVDKTYHMADAKTHLRDTTAGTDADFAWDPAAPDHSGMDTYCMSCHDANGAVSPGSIAIQALINAAGPYNTGKTASASNPFGDTISNRYDKMLRPAVVDVDSQFATTNNSHHGVKGARYTGRTRAGASRVIASPSTFAANSSATLKGVRKTMFEAGVLNALYSPLENAGGEVAPRTGAQTLGDDSTLHCGDCHTVGQWKVGSSETANGNPTPAAIGAHGSNNEYMLRNTLGTDERHTQNAYVTDAVNNVTYTNPNGAFLVCYNCHAYNKYGSIFIGTGLNIGLDRQPHAGEYDAAGRCNGIGNTIPFNGYTTGTATDGTQFASRFEGPLTKYSSPAPYAGEQNPDFGNIFGIQCLNCHNSGLGNGYGGIHGSANDTQTAPATVIIGATAPTGGYYIDGMGNATKVERFLPGLGDAAHVPGTLGGFTGGTVISGKTTQGVSNDTNWEQKHWQQTATTQFNLTTGAVTGTLTSAGAGCYTLGTGAAAGALEGPSVTGPGGPATEGFETWGGCDDHNAAKGKADHGFIKRIIRPVTY